MSAITWAVVLLAGLTCVLGNGAQTSIGEYPSLVQVEFRIGSSWLQQCIAVVITNYHTLTAANCVEYGNVVTRRIRAGTGTRGVGGEVRDISRIAIHPNYGLLGQDSDIAMIVVRTALPLGANIQQAPIIGEGIYLPTGLTLNLVGWGTTTEGGLIGDNNLYQLEVLTVSENACLNTYISDSTITENMFCVRRLGADGLDFDSRDCGAPLFYSNTVAGIASFGKSRADDQYPIVNTALGSFTSWIQEQASQL